VCGAVDCSTSCSCAADCTGHNACSSLSCPSYCAGVDTCNGAGACDTC
jgi:hypothetical protein